MNKILFSAIALMFATTAMAQLPKIPATYSNLGYDTNGRLYFENKGEKYFAEEFKNPLTIEQLPWAIFVSLSRVYLGVHYPADILVPAILSMLIAGMVAHLYKIYNPKFIKLFNHDVSKNN